VPDSGNLGVVEYRSDGVMEKHPILQYSNTPLLQVLSDNIYFTQQLTCGANENYNYDLLSRVRD
jgi:hypothetical protein